MMGTGRKLAILGVMVVGVVWLGRGIGWRVFERPLLDSDHIIITPSDTYRLARAIDKPLVVVADEVALDGDSQLAGDSALIGETITVAGQVNGNLTLMGESLAISGHVVGDASLIGTQTVVDGQVDGDLTVVGERLSIAHDARINGKIVACVDSLSDARPDGQIQPCGESEAFGAFTTALWGDGTLWNAGFSTVALAVSAFTSLLLSGAAALAVAIFPRQISYIEEAILTAPRRLGQTGFMTLLLAMGVTVALVVALAVIPPVGLVLLPVYALAGLAFLGMTVTGWITIALIVGNWLLRRVSRALLPPLITVVIGSIALFVLWHVLAVIPFGALAALLAMTVLGCVGLGAVVGTRLGTRSVQRRYFVQG